MGVFLSTDRQTLFLSHGKSLAPFIKIGQPINLQHSAASARGMQSDQFPTSYRWIAFFNMFQPLLSQLSSHGSNFCVLKRVKSTRSVANS
jgi:hypothetical protein